MQYLWATEDKEQLVRLQHHDARIILQKVSIH